MPAIQRNAIIPPRPKARQPAILRLKLEGCDLLKGVFLRIPLDPDVVDGLFREIAQELGGEGVGAAVCGVEGAEGLGDCVDGGVGGDGVLDMLVVVESIGYVGCRKASEVEEYVPFPSLSGPHREGTRRIWQRSLRIGMRIVSTLALPSLRHHSSACTPTLLPSCLPLPRSLSFQLLQ